MIFKYRDFKVLDCRSKWHLFLVIIAFGCINKPTNADAKRFKVGKKFVGYITDSTQVKDLKFIFKNDSIVNYKEDDSFVGGLNAFEIYEKNGNHLLSIYPFEALDSTAKISHIQLIDSRYKTAKSISNQSYLIDIKNAYSVYKIKNELEHLIIEIDTIKSSFVFGKKQLKRNFDFGTKLNISEIPDSTKIDAFIKFF